MTSALPLLLSVTFFVSQSGSDENPGTRAKPVRTAARAVELARGILADEPKTVVFSNGIHFFDEHADVRHLRDITFKAESPRKAILSGAVKVAGWRPDPQDARFLEADFPFEPRQETLYTLSVNSKLADFSAYPQLGGQDKLRYLATQEDAAKKNHTVFTYDPYDLPSEEGYRDLDLASVYLFIPQEWASTTTYIATNDWKNNTFYLKSRTDMPIGRFNTGYQIMNTRFGLRAPGSWMFEATKRRIVYWPREGEKADALEAYVSKLPALFDVAGTEYVRFEGLVMEGCSSAFSADPYRAVPMQAVIGGKNPCHLAVDNCEIRNTAGCGIQVINPRHCLLNRSHIHHVGYICAHFYDGGAHNEIYGCEFDHSGQLKVGGSGLRLNSYNKVVGNKFHDIAGIGASMWSSDTLFASNEIYRTMTAMRDGGGVYGAQVNCVYEGNYCHDNGDWPGLYNDEGGRDCVYRGNVFENSWWPFHMHDCNNIVMTNNTFVNDGGMRYSFQGSAHCVFRDNLIKTKLPIDRDPYFESCDEWSNDVQLRGEDGSYGEKTRLTLSKEVQPPHAPAVARRIAAPLGIDIAKDRYKSGFVGEGLKGYAGVSRTREGHVAEGVPTVNTWMGFDDRNLYVLGLYEYSKLSSYFGSINFGTTWGVHDGVRLHFKDFTITVFFAPKASGAESGICGSVVCSDPSLTFTTNNCWIATGWWGQSRFGLVLPLEKLGVKGDPVGQEIPYNLEFYNGDHDEYKYFNQPRQIGWLGRFFGDDGLLSSTLVFKERVIDQTSFVNVKERLADGSCWFPAPIWPEGGMVQAGPATCERPGDGYKSPLGFDSHNVELIGYVLAGAPKLQGFAMLPFSMKRDPSGEGRFTRRMDDSSEKASCFRYWVKTENWDLGTESTASANCAYLRFTYDRGGPVRVQLDAQDVAMAHWMKGRKAVEVTAADSSVEDGVFSGFVKAKVNGREEALYARIQFEPKPVAVRELPDNGRKGRRYILEFHLLPLVGNIQVKAAISDRSEADAAARFAADGEAIDFSARSAACRDAWAAFLSSVPAELKDDDLGKFLTGRYRERVRKNIGN